MEIRMNDKIKGFVLSQTDYKDSDILMQVATKEHGILSFVGKASKKLDSKNHFLPMCVYEFIIDYKENKTIYSIHGSKLIDCYFDDSDIDIISYKNIFIELALKNKDINTFDQLCFIYKHMNENNKYLLGSMFISYLSKKFGIMPNVDECAVCGHKKVVSISNNAGGFVCERHLNGLKSMPIDRLKKFRLAVKGGFENYDILCKFEYDINDFNLITSFYLDNTDLIIKSYNFYRTLN